MVGCKGVTLVFGVGIIVLVVNGVLSSYIMVVCLGLGCYLFTSEDSLEVIQTETRRVLSFGF